MSHVEQLQFFSLTRDHLPRFFSGCRVLEVGSLDINGSVRQFFPDCEYVGIDVGEGPGVDIVVAGQDYSAPDGSFDVVVSAECMEHNPAWEATTRNMVRLLRTGGLFLLTCAAPGRPIHGTSEREPNSSPLTVALGQDYYRNLDHKDFERSGSLAGLGAESHWINWASRDLYIAGIKDDTNCEEWTTYEVAVAKWLDRTHRSPVVERFVLAQLGSGVHARLYAPEAAPAVVARKARKNVARLRPRRVVAGLTRRGPATLARLGKPIRKVIEKSG